MEGVRVFEPREWQEAGMDGKWDSGGVGVGAVDGCGDVSACWNCWGNGCGNC